MSSWEEKFNQIQNEYQSMQRSMQEKYDSMQSKYESMQKELAEYKRDKTSNSVDAKGLDHGTLSFIHSSKSYIFLLTLILHIMFNQMVISGLVFIRDWFLIQTQ